MLSLDNAIEALRANLLSALVVNLPIAAVSYAVGAVRGSGLVAGLVCGVIVFSLGGYRAFLILLFFFLAGSVVSRVGVARKKAVNAAEEKQGARGAGSVVGKCTVGALVALLMGMTGGSAMHGGEVAGEAPAALLALAYAGAFAAALADTFASELGPLYGETALLLTTLKPVPHGTPGGVSIAGTAFGVAGAMLVGLLGAIIGVLRMKAIVYFMVASLIAGVLESFLRARWPGQAPLAKQLPNFAVTLVGSIGSVLLALALGY